MGKTYQSIDHTGDLGVRVEAPTLVELIRRVSLALSDTLVDADRIEPLEARNWEVQGQDLEGLVVAQLQEILFRMDADGMVFGEFSIRLRSPLSLSCQARGEALDRDRHGFKTEIKAITYHGLKVQEDAGKWTAQVIFDV